ncbi:putative RING finger protein C6B12.07c [Erysiphe neolycopersici]|uniref:Putative RING finger protein C6B12.07c n=1 Tax=Erysiphe neolycopersici TaxID=212602 RepID=A0A420HYG8_9PEZI|nr:putative RING finger protein C6B12.07c [Erysiphe neolycopersici]
MKFAHEFRSMLETEGFPERWVASAVPYRQLKKCLKKVQTELYSAGLNLTASGQKRTSNDKDFPKFRDLSFLDDQKFMNSKNQSYAAKLFLLIRFQNGVVIDSALSQMATTYSENFVSERFNYKIPIIRYRNIEGELPQQMDSPFVFDVEFFNILKEDVASLDLLHTQEQKALGRRIEALSIAIKTLAKPSKFRRSDMYRWRQLFQLYLEAGIFFSNHELDCGIRDSRTSAKRLEWFQNQLTQKKLGNLFKIPASKEALDHFVSINISLLQVLKFQELNQKAVSKILKKFAKRTKLNVGSSFSQLIESNTLKPGSIAKAVCSKVTQDLVQIVPQIDDYLCPICLAIVWQPIRMKCRHFFCIQCTIILQKKKKRFCPLCRENVIMEADQDNIDKKLVNFLKKYFPKEVRLKQIADETTNGIERYGVYYKHPSEENCCIM